MKKTLIILFGFLVTLTAAALIVPGFVDWSQYRDQITNLARDYTGRELTIEGDISFHVLPNPALSLEKLTMKNSEGGVSETLITLESLDVNVAFMPLLTKDIQVESLTLEGAHIALEVNEDGVKNWVFSEENTNTSQSTDDGFRLDSFNIINSTISYRDETRGIFEEFTNITAQLRAESSTGPFEASGNLMSRGEPLGIEVTSGKIQEARSFPLSLKVTVPGAEDGVSFGGTVVLDGQASAVSGEVNAKGSNAQRMVSSFQTLFQMEGEHPVNSARPFDISTKLVATKARYGLKPLSLRVGESVAEGDVLYLPEEETPVLNLNLKVNTVILDNWLAGQGERSEGERGVKTLPDILGNLDLSIEAIDYNGGIVSRAGLKGVLENQKFEIERMQALLPGGSDIGVMGQFDLGNLNAPGFDGAIRVSANNLRGLLNWAGVDIETIPAGQLAGFNMESGVKIEGDTYNLIRARGQIDVTRFNGDARIRLSGRPNIAVNFGLTRFNLDNYFPNKSTSDTSKNWPQIQADFDKFFDPLKDFDGSFKIKSQQANLRDIQIQNLDLDAGLNRGVLNIKTLKSSDTLGIKTDISGTIEVGANSPKLDLVLDLEAGNLATFFKWAKIETKADPFELGVVSTKGRLSTDLRNASFNLGGQGVFGNYTLEGTVSGLSDNPETFDISTTVEHPDHMDLFRRLGMDFPLEGDPAPLDVSFKAKGSFDKMEALGNANLLGGLFGFEGQLGNVMDDPNGEISLTLSHSDLVHVAKAFSLELTPSVENIGGLSLEASLKGTQNNFALTNLTSQVGPSQLTGGLEVNKTGARPEVKGSLRFDKLPIDNFVSDSQSGAVEAHTINGERWSRDTINTSFVKDWDANIALAAGEVTFGRYRLENPQAQIRSKDGVLDAPGVRGEIFGGNLDAQVTIDTTSTPKLILDMALRDANMESVVVAFADIRPVTGALNLSGHFEGQGNSQFDLIASLVGRGEITARDGVIKGLNLRRLSDDILNFSKLSDLVRVLGTSFSGGETPYSVFTTEFEAQTGILETTQLNFVADGALIEGNGSFNLPRWTMDGDATIKLNKDQVAPPIGMKLVGQIDRPDITYQTNLLKAYIGEQIAQKALAATLANSLPGATPQSGDVTTEELAEPGEPGEAPVPEPKTEDKIIKGLFDLINSRKKTEEENKEEAECEGPDCPPILF